jgi:hypothetical protein
MNEKELGHCEKTHQGSSGALWLPIPPLPGIPRRDRAALCSRALMWEQNETRRTQFWGFPYAHGRYLTFSILDLDSGSAPTDTEIPRGLIKKILGGEGRGGDHKNHPNKRTRSLPFVLAH